LLPARLTLPVAARAKAERTVAMVSGYAPGGSTDIAARFLADRLPTYWPGVRMVVENPPGASGAVAGEWPKRQPADGRVIMVAETGSHAIATGEA
jgi:tripartite-type tricarboxylate transporter receptor subunit TctC